ncbi:hypothetical protein D3C87_2079540 [compost metagenome]
MFYQLLEKIEHLGILDDFDFIEQDRKWRNAADQLFKHFLGAGWIVAQRLLASHGQ